MCVVETGTGTVLWPTIETHASLSGTGVKRLAPYLKASNAVNRGKSPGVKHNSRGPLNATKSEQQRGLWCRQAYTIDHSSLVWTDLHNRLPLLGVPRTQVSAPASLLHLSQRASCGMGVDLTHFAHHAPHPRFHDKVQHTNRSLQITASI